MCKLHFLLYISIYLYLSLSSRTPSAVGKEFFTVRYIRARSSPIIYEGHVYAAQRASSSERAKFSSWFRGGGGGRPVKTFAAEPKYDWTGWRARIALGYLFQCIYSSRSPLRGLPRRSRAEIGSSARREPIRIPTELEDVGLGEWTRVRIYRGKKRNISSGKTFTPRAREYDCRQRRRRH